MNLTMGLSPIGSQVVVANSSGAFAEISYNMSITVHTPSGDVFACALEFDGDLGLDMWLGQSSSPDYKYAFFANVTTLAV
jgi:hypothetical protein